MSSSRYVFWLFNSQLVSSLYNSEIRSTISCAHLQLTFGFLAARIPIAQCRRVHYAIIYLWVYFDFSFVRAKTFTILLFSHCANDSARIQRRHHKSLNHLAIRPSPRTKSRSVPCQKIKQKRTHTHTKGEGVWASLQGMKNLTVLGS